MPQEEGWSKSHPAAGGLRLPGLLGNSRVLTVLIVHGDDGALGSCQQPARSLSGLLALLVGSLFPSFTSPPPLPAHFPLSLPLQPQNSLHLLSLVCSPSGLLQTLRLLGCPSHLGTALKRLGQWAWELALFPPCPLLAPSLCSHWKFPLD